MSGLENLMDNFSLSNSTSMKGKSMNAMKGWCDDEHPDVDGQVQQGGG
jgi:hypothetical protein